MKHPIFNLLLLVILLSGMVFIPQQSAAADNITSDQLISLVNAIRTGLGLPALNANSILNGTAQWTAQYMADNNLSDHIGNVVGRIQAAGYGSNSTVFATENWAGYQNGATISWVTSVWSDAAHMLPMTSPNYQDIGAGVATSSSGRTIYIVHAAYISGSGSSGSTSQNQSTTPVPAGSATNSNYVSPLITSTSQPDGSIIHVVQSGQSLWSIAIAYGTLINDILTLNQLPTNAVIWVGQEIIVAPSSTPTIEPTVTETPRPSTRTPSRTPGPQSPTPNVTITLTPTATLQPLLESIPFLDRRSLGIIIILVCGLGLLMVVVGSFRQKK